MKNVGILFFYNEFDADYEFSVIRIRRIKKFEIVYIGDLEAHY